MAFVREPRPGSPFSVAVLALGVGGLAWSITLLFLGMRAVMDVGGMCAEGGPYVIATSCPEGSAAATLLGVFGLFLFGAIAMWGGARVGGVWIGVAGLAWVGLFGALGWNFLEYGIFSPPEGETIVWGWLIPGVLFELMAFGPVAMVVAAVRVARRSGGGAAVMARSGLARRMSGLPEPDPPAVIPGWIAPEPGRDDAGEQGAEASGDVMLGVQAPGAETPDLLDHLERLADMRDRGLLDPDEYATAKAAIIRQLETDS